MKEFSRARASSASVNSVHICCRLPASAHHRNLYKRSLLIFDQSLCKHKPNLKSWIKLFPHRYSVTAGETLKDLTHYSCHMQNILSLWQKGDLNRNSHLVALGGGSVGDFVGFTASVLQRGVPLTMVPTTWLAAIDSSHGGKTALNVHGIKNQIGTFHPAAKVIISKELLFASSTQRTFDHAQDALGELFKMALIDGKLFDSIEGAPLHMSNSELLWLSLRKAIDAKYRVVHQDPFEVSGLRQVLNLGHTLGHVIEANFRWPHGNSVSAGLTFALKWSLHRKYLKLSEFNRIENLMRQRKVWIEPPSRPMPSGAALKLISGDKKKMDSHRLRFVFLKKPGAPLIKNMIFRELVEEGVRQKWIR